MAVLWNKLNKLEGLLWGAGSPLAGWAFSRHPGPKTQCLTGRRWEGGERPQARVS